MEEKIVKKETRPIDRLKTMLSAPSVQEQFGNALSEHKDLFIASLVEIYSGDASLQKCEPKLVIAEALKAATMRLPINKQLGFAYLVVYNNNKKDEDGNWTKVPTPTFIPGYKGYIQLAMRTGQYKTINADYVYEGEIGKADKLSGTINFDGHKKSDKIIGYFCYFELINGFSKTLYMTVEEMAKYAIKYSPSIPKGSTVESLIKLANNPSDKKTVGWSNFNEMGLKTVIRRLLSKYGYLSVEMQNALSRDYEASESRDELISSNANSTTINTEDVEYEEVNSKKTETEEKTKEEKTSEKKVKKNEPEKNVQTEPEQNDELPFEDPEENEKEEEKPSYM
mgnify:CR=1 FL=1